jgi:hypothetical protein
VLLLVVHVAPVTVHVLAPDAMTQDAGVTVRLPLGYASLHEDVVPPFPEPAHDHVQVEAPATLVVLVPAVHA